MQCVYYTLYYLEYYSMYCSLVYRQHNHLAWCIRMFDFYITKREEILTIEKVSCFEKGSSIDYIQVTIIDYILLSTL